MPQVARPVSQQPSEPEEFFGKPFLPFPRTPPSFWVILPTSTPDVDVDCRPSMGHEAFNRFVGLPLEHAGWLPEWVVINNSTDGVGNPHSKLYSAAQVRRAFSDFRSVRLEKHFFPRNKLPIIGSWRSEEHTSEL